jgi:hypothetical protein
MTTGTYLAQKLEEERIERLIREERFHRNRLKNINNKMENHYNWYQHVKDTIKKIEDVGGSVVGLNENKITWGLYNADGTWDTITEPLNEEGEIPKPEDQKEETQIK